MNTKFNEHIKDEVRSRADIAAIVGRYVNLKQSGQTLKGLCPFHKEKSPSFHVNPAKGYFHCFGCGKGGDVFSFLQEIEGVSFPEALTTLAEDLGIVIDKSNSEIQLEHTNSLSKSIMFSIHEEAANFFYSQIRENTRAIDYFKSRQLTPETVREFHLGYAPKGWSGLINHSISKNIDPKALVECGLAVQNEGGTPYDRFRDRIIFPLRDVAGKTIAFAGRGLDKENMPKYLNSPETPLYHKNRYLYGLDVARTAIKEKGYVIILEGYMDFLSLYQAGIKNAVAVSGTALTTEHAQILRRFVPKVTLLFDGDSAGQKAAERSLFILAPHNLDVSVLTLPQNEDPDSFINKNGADTFLKLLEKERQPGFDYLIQKALKDNDGTSSIGKSAVINYLTPFIKSITDPIVQSDLIRRLSEMFLVDTKLIQANVSSVKEQTFQINEVVHTTNHINDKKYLSTLEGSFLNIISTQPSLIEEACHYIEPETLTDGISGDIYSLFIEVWREKGTLNGCTDHISDPSVKRLISLLFIEPFRLEHIHEELVQKIIYLRSKYLRAQIRRTREHLKRQPDSKTELLERLKDFSTQLKELDEGE